MKEGFFRCFVVAGIAFATAVGGCGYRFVEGLPFEGRQVFVGPVVNGTLEPGLEEPLRTALIETIAVDGRLEAAAEERADLVLEASVGTYNILPTSESGGFVTQYEIELVGSFLFRDRAGNVLVRYDDVRAPVRETYRVGADVLRSEAARARATEHAVRALAREFVGRIAGP